MSQPSTAAVDPPAAAPARTDALACALLAGAVLLLFGRVVTFPFLAFDDAELILRNPQIVAPLRAPLDLLFTPHVGYVVPITVALQALLHALGGAAPWPYHAAALVLHALFVCQLFLLLRHLRASPILALGGALLFAVHPLVVQPVAWAICVKDLLMANFVLLAVRALLRSLATSEAVARRSALTAVLAGLFAMLAKPTATLLGFAWLAFWLALRRRSSDEASRVIGPAAILSVSGVLLGAMSRLLHEASFGREAEVRWTPVFPLEVLGRQVLHVFWPVDLLVMYPDPAEAPSTALRALGVGALLALATALWLLRRSPRGTLLLAVALAIYVPTSNLVPFGRVISDSYMYVPLSLLIAGLALASRLVLARGRSAGKPLAGAVLALGLALAAGTHAQLPRYRGGAALWAPVVRAYPRFSMGYIYFADEQVFRGEPRAAVESYRRGFRYGYDPRHLLEYGTTLALADRLPDAECVLIEAVAYGSEPGYARFNLAATLAVHSDYVPQYPAISGRLLREVDASRRSGALAWPPPLAAGLQRQLDRTREPAADAVWPRRNCAVLRAAP